jgi:hypothetical protein
MELTLTHHMIDDVQPADEAMDLFRNNFRLTACVVDEDGKTMRYRLKSAITASVWEINAKKVIAALNLPLVVNLDVWNTGSLVHEVSLNISYKPQTY